MKNHNTKSIILVALFSLFFVISYGQEYPGIKKGAIEKIDGTAYGLVKHKKKTGLYNFETKQFIVKPEKSFFYHFEEDGFMFIRDKENMISAYDLKIANTSSFISKKQDELLLSIIPSEIATNYILVPPVNLLNNEISLENLRRDYILNNDIVIGFKLIDKSLIIYHQIPEDPDPFAMPLKSKIYPEEDSVILDSKSGFLNAVYPPNIPAINKSGVYNVETGTWQIAPKYERILFEKGYFICGVGNVLYQEPTAYFDIYKKTGDEIIATEFMGVKNNQDMPVSLFSEYKLKPDGDRIFYYTQSEQGVGLINLRLFSDEYSNDYINKMEAHPGFINYEIFAPKYEFTHKIAPELKYLVAYSQDGFELVSHRLLGFESKINRLPIPIKHSFKSYTEYDSEKNYYLIDGVYYEDTLNQGQFNLSPIEITPSLGDPALSLEKIGDSLLSVQYHLQEFFDPYALPFMSYDYPDEDSLIMDPNTGYYMAVYPPNDPGVYESGIYDLRSKKWLIEPENAWILKTYDGFLISKPILFDNLTLDRFDYSFKNNDGSYLFENIKEDELGENPAYQKLWVPLFKVDSLYLKNALISENEYYFNSNGALGLTDIEKREIMHEPAEYLYHHQQSQTFVSINEGILQIKNDWGDTLIDLKNCTYLNAESGVESLKIHSETVSKITYATYNDYDYNCLEYKVTDKAKLEAIKKLNNKKSANENFQLSRINDSLIYIEDWSDDFRIDAPLKSWDYPGEDSIIFDQNTGFYYAVYPPDIPGHNRSGVYDYAHQKWIATPTNRLVIAYEDNYILAVPVMNEIGIVLTYDFRIVDANGKEVLKPTTFNELHPDYRAFLIERDDFKSILSSLRVDEIEE